MTGPEIRQSFLDFFREKKHTIVPSASLMPDSPNLLFTNAGMNQFVPIFLGQEKPAWNPPRTADTQKCIRAGGKHNDLDDVGLDTYHHTFFEMLGNWSFGDYFKKEAIAWAWELVVERWKFPAQRLYATVYRPGPGEPSEFDQEAYDHWAQLFRDADLDPAIHIVDGNKKDNFWMMGDTGPCGPCSELHVDLTPDGDTRGSLVNKGDPRCIEIWNLVFIQFNANPDGSFKPLPQRHVDTGMGFERVTSILQGTKNFSDFSGTISNYETDVFRPIFDELEEVSGKEYGRTLPDLSQPSTLNPQQATDVAFRVIADHIRTLSFAIADGIQPSNEGRGYVLRRILRRAVRYGRSLGFHDPFFFKLVDVLARTMGDVFPEVRANKARVVETIRREEEAFNKTLDEGLLVFEKVLQVKNAAVGFRKTLSDLLHVADAAGSGAELGLQAASSNVLGAVGRLVLTTVGDLDEQIASRIMGRSDLKRLSNAASAIVAAVEAPGFPSESTELTSIQKTVDEFREAATNFLKVSESFRTVFNGEAAFLLYDTYGFPLDLTELLARERGLAVDVAGFERLMDEQRNRARKAQKKEAITVEDENLKASPTQFVGYDFAETEAVVAAVLPGKEPGEFHIALNRTACYAEMGGQVGDHGRLHVPGHDRTEVGQLVIKDTQKRGDVFLHRAVLVEGRAPEPGEAVRVSVDGDRRQAIERHHTVTHLLHWALHEKVSKEATQKGSYVGPEKLTFDFSSAALSAEQKRNVENLVNEKIRENAPVSWSEIPHAEAKQRSDIQQFFGDKYGEVVRVVQIGGTPQTLNGYSMELCGGTHVRATGEIESFRIVSESAIAAGVRRIEAVSGAAAREWARHEAARQQEKFDALVKKKNDLAPLSKFSDAADANEMLKQIDVRAEALHLAEADVLEFEKKKSKAAEADLQRKVAGLAGELAEKHAKEPFCVAQIEDADGNFLQALADALQSRLQKPVVLGGTAHGAVTLVASVPKSLTKNIQAGKLIQQIAPIVGGKGGGRPESARGGGKDPSKLSQALDEARKILAGEL